MMTRIVVIGILVLLVGCAGKQDMVLPVHMPSADKVETGRQGDQDEWVQEIIPIIQVLRPMDVLDVIFHIGTVSSEAYRIQPGDHVEMSFLTANELSATHLVLPDGTVEMPYVGRISVAGLTTAEVRLLLLKNYKGILKNPVVAVAVPKPMAQLENLRMTLNHPAFGMSREILVGADGRASFPLIGSLLLQGMSLDELRDELNRRYASLLGQMRVDVLLKSTIPNQVYVLGEVGQPGAYTINRPVSVLEALTLAHGANAKARLDSVVVMRRKGNEAVAYLYDVQKAIDGKSRYMAYLQADDLLYIPQTRLSKAGQISRQLADIILFQGFGFNFSYRVDNKNSD